MGRYTRWILLLVLLATATGSYIRRVETVNNLKCAQALKSIVIRGLTSDGKPDIASLKVALNLDNNFAFYLVPCVDCGDASRQISDVCDQIYKPLNGSTQAGVVFVEVMDETVWKGTKEENRNFIKDISKAVSACAYISNFDLIVTSSKASWENIMGDFNFAAEASIMYVNTTKNHFSNDYVPFGGWPRPGGKFYSYSSIDDCGNAGVFTGEYPIFPKSSN